MRMLKFLVVLVVLVGAVGVFVVEVPYAPGAETFVEIAPGTGTVGIAEQLQRAGVVRSAWAFEGVRVWRGATGATGSLKAGSLKAGEYRFEGPATVGEVYDRLRRGDVSTVTVVVPEGFNVFDVAEAVAAAGLGGGRSGGESSFPAHDDGTVMNGPPRDRALRERFLVAARENAGLVGQWSPGASSVEGYLFPDTYKFSRHATDAEMIAAMVKRFGQVAGRLGLSGTDVGRVVTMASLVEKEVHVDSERAVVAGVFENRLAAGMPLQTDPAVIYASMLRGTWTGVIHQSELHSDSAYNTYTHKGLPPGPICSPGLAALRAAMRPAKTEYLYFVADAQGGTRFSTGLKEHNGKVAEMRRGRE